MTRIIWTCAACGSPIFGRSGYLGVDHTDLDGDGPIRWAAWHDRCHPDDTAAYDVGIDEINTHAGVLAWTEHLSDKTWYRRSDWVAVMKAHDIDVAPVEVPERKPGDELAAELAALSSEVPT